MPKGIYRFICLKDILASLSNFVSICWVFAFKHVVLFSASILLIINISDLLLFKMVVCAIIILLFLNSWFVSHSISLSSFSWPLLIEHFAVTFSGYAKGSSKTISSDKFEVKFPFIINLPFLEQSESSISIELKLGTGSESIFSFSE